MKKIFVNRSQPIDSENPYWISFSDIMAGLLVIFILASVFLIIKLSTMEERVQDAIKEIEQTNKLRALMLTEIKENLAHKNINVEISENHTVLRIDSDRLYFESLSYDIPENQKKLVAEIGYAILDVISQKDRLNYIDTIFIEGHTDSWRTVSFPMGNWGLAAYRAISVWKYWTEELNEGWRFRKLKNFYGRPLFSVSGYAETRPIELNDDTENKRRKNRRIDIRFSMKKPVIKDYENILDILEMIK